MAAKIVFCLGLYNRQILQRFPSSATLNFIRCVTTDIQFKKQPQKTAKQLQLNIPFKVRSLENWSTKKKGRKSFIYRIAVQVMRSQSGNLPVYTKYFNKGKTATTTIRRIYGDLTVRKQIVIMNSG